LHIGYIVLAYKSPAQIQRLLSRVGGGESSVVVHVDRIMDDDDYRELRRRAEQLGNVRFLDRTRTYWGGFGLVRATMRAIDTLLADDAVEYAILLTGQDYPLRSAGEIERFLEAAGGRTFLHNSPLPYAAWGPGGGLERIEHWHLMRRRPHRVRLPWKRSLPADLVPFGGEAYWCLSRRAAEHVSRFVRTNPKVVRFFEHVFVPDELFFQTIVMNSELRHEVVNDTLHYVDWDAEPGPAILTSRDVPSMIDSGKLFARKFDVEVDSEVLDRLDKHARVAGVHS
jgi:Core-2/I-Branching enzyme